MSDRVESDADEARVGQLGMVAFNFPSSRWEQWKQMVPRDDHRVLRDKGEILAALGLYPAGQWYGGRVVSMTGLALVCVDPTRRKQGLSTRLLTRTLNELNQHGVALSTLYPSTQQPYRRVGYEQGGHHLVYEHDFYPPQCDATSLAIHLVSSNDLAALASVDQERGRHQQGVLQRNSGLWKRLFDGRNNATPVRAYLFGPPEKPEGYLVCFDSQESQGRVLVARDVVANTPAAAATIWEFLYGHRSVCRKVHWPGSPNDSMLLTTEECRPKIVSAERWMSRIVNVEKALTERGYDHDLSEPLLLEIDDATVPANHGLWKFDVEGGMGTLQKAAANAPGERLHCSIRGLSALYTGLFNAFTLAQRSLIDGSPRVLAAANACFAGDSAWMPDTF